MLLLYIINSELTDPVMLLLYVVTSELTDPVVLRLYLVTSKLTDPVVLQFYHKNIVWHRNLVGLHYTYINTNNIAKTDTETEQKEYGRNRTWFLHGPDIT